ncbi:hypothetical protein D5S17_27405 [Pseudonocardiaceae bacterium YIM PH 21723]|nr:hypothetical protein D5S17_27405 [Pseudonocardiaceae bacterium YIM PH 21723]
MQQAHASHRSLGPRQSRQRHPLAGKTVSAARRALLAFGHAVQQTEEVVPVNLSTWVLSSGVTVGR